MQAPARLTTADDLLRMPDTTPDGFQLELVKGELRRTRLPGIRHGVIEMRLGQALANHVDQARLGVIVPGDTGFKLEVNPDTVRFPDIGFVRRERIQAAGIMDGYWPGAPDLAIEILSPSDSVQAIREKVSQYLDHGTSEVWFVEPKAARVTIHRRNSPPQPLGLGDEIDGGDLLPGFRLAVATLFAEL